MDMKTRIAQLLADTLRKAWPQAGELPQAEELRPLLEVPPEPKLGDYAFPCFRFAKTLRMAPPSARDGGDSFGESGNAHEGTRGVL